MLRLDTTSCPVQRALVRLVSTRMDHVGEKDCDQASSAPAPAGRRLPGCSAELQAAAHTIGPKDRPHRHDRHEAQIQNQGSERTGQFDVKSKHRVARYDKILVMSPNHKRVNDRLPGDAELDHIRRAKAWTAKWRSNDFGARERAEQWGLKLGRDGGGDTQPSRFATGITVRADHPADRR